MKGPAPAAVDAAVLPPIEGLDQSLKKIPGVASFQPGGFALRARKSNHKEFGLSGRGLSAIGNRSKAGWGRGVVESVRLGARLNDPKTQ